MNEDETENKSEYDFFADAKLPTDGILKEFQSIVEAAGRYKYVELVNLSDSLMTPEELSSKLLQL